jgi:hypothetical protein
VSPARRQSNLQSVQPKEFCQALWEAARGAVDPRTLTGVRTLQLGIVLAHFIRTNPDPFEFEAALEDLTRDPRPQRALLRTVARQVLRLWRNRRFYRAPDGRLVVPWPPGRTRRDSPPAR